MRAERRIFFRGDMATSVQGVDEALIIAERVPLGKRGLPS
jgi:hypothetical protein